MFHFDDLSPLDFERLVADLLRRDLGVRFHTYKDGRDGGIDLRAEIKGQKVFVQAKRYIHTTFSKLKSGCKNDNHAWQQRQTQPDIFWLATSLPLSKAQKVELVKQMPSLPITIDEIISNEDLQIRLKNNPDIVRSHMKLWLNESSVLEQFLNNDLYENTQFTTENIRSAMRTYVEHGGLSKSREIIETEGSIVITGPPGIGKSTLANMLFMQHVDEGWTPMIVTDPKDAMRAVKRGERRIMYFDDFLGSHKLTSDRLGNAEAPITQLLERANKDDNFRFILTSRDYILSEAGQSSDRLSDEVLSQKKYLLQLPEYSKIQKAKILYNHIFFSSMSSQHKEQLLGWGFCNAIITHPNFNPRLVKTMTGKIGTDTPSETYRERFQEVLDRPDILWKVPYYEHFENSDRLLVLTLAAHRGSMFSRLSREQCLRRYIDYNTRLNFNIPDNEVRPAFRRSLRKMDGGMLQFSNQKVYLTNPGVQGFLDDALFNDGHFNNLVKTSQNYSELLKLWNDRNLAPDGWRLDIDAWTDSIEVVVNTSLVESSVVSLCIDIKENNALNTRSDEILETAVLRYIGNADEDCGWDIHAMGKILYFMSDYNPLYIAEPNVVEAHKMDVLSRIEIECESMLENADESWDLETALSFASELVESVHCTDTMKEVGESIADNALSGAAESFRHASGEDAEAIVNDIEVLDTIYGLDITDVRYEIEQHANDQDAYEDMRAEEYREQYLMRRPESDRSSPPDVIEPSENEVISDMFKNL